MCKYKRHILNKLFWKKNACQASPGTNMFPACFTRQIFSLQSGLCVCVCVCVCLRAAWVIKQFCFNHKSIKIKQHGAVGVGLCLTFNCTAYWQFLVCTVLGWISTCLHMIWSSCMWYGLIVYIAVYCFSCKPVLNLKLNFLSGTMTFWSRDVNHNTNCIAYVLFICFATW